MKITLVTVVIFFGLALDRISFAEEPNVKEYVQVLALYNQTKDGSQFYAVALNAFGQIIYYRYEDSDKTKKSFMRLGPKNVSYSNIKIVSSANGIDFICSPCSAGASLTVIGKDGQLKEIFSLPRGVSLGPDGVSYFANIELAEITSLPLREDGLDEAWLHAEELRKLDVSKPNSK